MVELARLINNQQIIAQELKKLPDLKTPVVDGIYTNRRTHPFPQIGVAEIASEIDTVPVVRRGAPGVPVGKDSSSVYYIEPQPIRIEDAISAVDANNMKSGMVDWRQVLSSKLDRLRRKIRATTEALCAQSLTGKIQYPMLLENGGTTTYEVDFTNGGDTPTLSYTASTLWSDASADVTKVLDDLVKIEELMQGNGWGGTLRFWAGRAAYSALAKLVMAARAEKKIQLQYDGKIINIAGYEIELFVRTYKHPITGDSVKIVPDNKILVWDASAPFTLYYLAIDHFKAGFQATPLFVYSYEKPDGDAYVIFAESKPLPCPVVKAICWATVA